ncbi:MAG TPA: HAD family phosphatase [Streptosporangiaceae bacterium]|nr:HAD family phosphatase [Streptosporangiaceae bacterium]
MSWVLFDFGNVVCYSQSEHDLELLAAAVGCPVPELTETYWPPRLDYDRADLDADTYWQKVGAAQGRTFSPAEVTELVRLDVESWSHINPHTEALIADLAAAGNRLALLSNAPTDVALAIAALPIAACFEHCFFSCDLRATKPDPAVYQAVLTRLQAQPADVVFLDDRAENVTGAADLGIRSVHFTGAQQARAALAALGVRGAM